MNTLQNEFNRQKDQLLETKFYMSGARDWHQDDQWLLAGPEEFAEKFLKPLAEKLNTLDDQALESVNDCPIPLLITIRWRGVQQLGRLAVKCKKILVSYPPASTITPITSGEIAIEKGVYIALGVKITPLPLEITRRNQHLDHLRALNKHGLTADEAASLFFFFPKFLEQAVEQRKKIVIPGAYCYSNLVLGGIGHDGPGFYCERDKSISAGGAYIDAEQPTIEVHDYERRRFFSGEKYSLPEEATCIGRLYSE